MNKSRLYVKNKMSPLEIILRFFFGFLIPFVVINGIIFFLFIQVPTINITKEDSSDYEESKIKFQVECILPITEIKTYFNDTDVPYTKNGDTYIINADENGTYKIVASALNKASSEALATVETKDVIAPTIDLENAVVTGNTLIFSVKDEQSEINYDNLYGLLENGEKISPSHIDAVSGNIQFKIESGEKIIIHVEDIEGNGADITFTIGE